MAGLGLAATIGLVPNSPAFAEPDIDDVQAQVDKLYRDAEQASERYNDARIELKELRKELRSLRADEERQDSRAGAVREQLKDSVLREFEGGQLGDLAGVVVSEDPQKFLSGLTTVSAVDSVQQGLYSDYSEETSALAMRRKATQQRADQVASLEQQLEDEKTSIDSKYDQAKDKLDDLKAEEREELLSRQSTRVPSSADVPASGRASAAVQYAMAQVGDAYVWGAAGPSAFDCSGLTMMAWAQAGVSLPHSSSAQYSSGARISEGDLQPGDLVFYYSPISHVGMYIGNGMIVHAANPGAGVRVDSLHTMPYVGAVRPG
ncbi:C40 family peptidase [Nocardioides insulae]|uniref:C40 family peptidase n=1 Tax=Nocardioides insulae TaxID=394734 RepID=UPI0005635599|nr:NlpC/P60 family protein [Nocardioides insulae]